MDHQMRFRGPCVCRAVWLLAALLSLRDMAGAWGLTSDTDSSQSGTQADEGPREVHPRHKRSWVWNQFFVLEEYTGNDPLYVGKVRCQLIFDLFGCKELSPFGVIRAEIKKYILIEICK